MVKCKVVEDKLGNLTVTFKNKDLYLQSDYDISAFGVACGIIKAPKDWDGIPSNLEQEWYNADWKSITSCPDEYEEQAK